MLRIFLLPSAKLTGRSFGRPLTVKRWFCSTQPFLNNVCELSQSIFMDVYVSVAGAYVVGSNTTALVTSQNTFVSVSACADAITGVSTIIESNIKRFMARISFLLLVRKQAQYRIFCSCLLQIYGRQRDSFVRIS